MVGQSGGGRQEPLLEEPFLVFAHVLVELLAAALVDGVVADVEDGLAEKAHHLVVDLEIQAHQPERLGPFEEGMDAGFVEGCAPREDAHGNLLAEGGSPLQDLTVFLSQGADLLGDDALQGPSQVGGVQWLDDPVSSHELDLPFLEQVPDDGRDEKGIPAGDLDQLSLEASGHLRIGEDPVQVLGDGQRPQRPEHLSLHQHLLRAVLEEALHRRRLGLTAQTQGFADSATQHQGEFAGAGCLAEETERRLVGELQVVREEDERPPAHRLDEEPSEGDEDTLPCFVIDATRDVFIDQSGQHVGEVTPILRRDPVEELDSHVSPLVEEVDQDPSREVVRAASLFKIARDPRYEERIVGLEVVPHRVEESRLAHARGALEDQNLTAPRHQTAQSAVHYAELLLAADDAP